MEHKMTDAMIVSVENAIATISINDAPMNRMSGAFMDELEALITEIGADESIRVLVFTGEGDRNFSVGMDLKQLPDLMQKMGGPDAVFDQRLRVLAAIENLGKPSVATLFGYCLGGGLELPLACHFRLAAEEGAQIGLPELDLGSVPAWGGSARLTRCVGRDHALDMILRAKKISGPEALRIGLVQEVWPNSELKQRAQDLATELAAMPRLAVKSMLDCIVGSEVRTLEQSLLDERAAVELNRGTADSREGMMSFLEKRKPVFNQ
jgi:enoyl-CoA hydratase